MSTRILSVLIPTTGRRPAMLGEVVGELYDQFPVGRCEVLTIEGLTWGQGLNELARRAKGAYWACLCDDTVPHPGWFAAGRAMLDERAQPAARYLNRDGSPLRPGWDDAPHGKQLDWCRAFLLTPALYGQVGPFIDATWWSDIDYSERLVKAGVPILACDGYTFTHLDGDRDWQTAEVDAQERAAYAESHRRQGIETFQ